MIKVLERGTVCVERSVNSKIEWLPLADQFDYPMWVGCFSITHTQVVLIADVKEAAKATSDLK